jgi:hypothetical protein
MATPARKSFDDGRRGPVPDIQADGEDVVFRVGIAGVKGAALLIIRCDAAGNAWASIEPTDRPAS